MTRIASAVALAALLLLSCSRERLGPPPEGVHLRSPGAIPYFLDKDASDALELGVREAFQLWADATEFKFGYEGKASGNIARDGRNRVAIMARWPRELPITAPSWCQVYLDKSGAIAEADILLNAQAFAFTTKRESRAGSLYIEEVLSKAIGRSLGIGLGNESGDAFRAARQGEPFEPGIQPAEMAAYLSLYRASPSEALGEH